MKNKEKKDPFVLAISGVKNSGKTSLIEKLIVVLKKQGLTVAVIKHDGHEFEADVKGRDSYRFGKAGAYGRAVFSMTKFMLVKEIKLPTEKELIALFQEADIILLEGFKQSSYPKIELIRQGNSKESVCSQESLLGLVTNTEVRVGKIPVFDFSEVDAVANLIIKEAEKKKRCE